MKTVTVKTAELKGLALDWTLGLIEGYELNLYGVGPSIRARVPGLGVHAPWRPSYYWNQGGPLLENLLKTGKWEIVQGLKRGEIMTQNFDNECTPVDGESWGAGSRYFPGESLLMIAMRTLVYSKLGDEVQVPQELVK